MRYPNMKPMYELELMIDVYMQLVRVHSTPYNLGGEPSDMACFVLCLLLVSLIKMTDGRRIRERSMIRTTAMA